MGVNPSCLLMYPTIVVLSILTRTCCPLKKGRKCFSTSDTTWSSRQFIWNNCICDLNVPFIILPTQVAPQAAREASVVMTFLDRIITMVTHVVRKVVRFQGCKAIAKDAPRRNTDGTPAHRWKGLICKWLSRMTIKADAISPSSLRNILNFSLVPVQKSVRQAQKASTLSADALWQQPSPETNQWMWCSELGTKHSFPCSP